MNLPRLLVIAGSDSSGGAGVQADIKTATALGVYAAAAVTAVTVQDTGGVYAVHPIPAVLLREQIIVTLADIGADAIKIGMLGSAASVDAAADGIAQRKDIPLVLDPVLASTSGMNFLDDDAVARLMATLLPRATLVTPNIPEAARLSGVAIHDENDGVRAARNLLELGAHAVLVKGGHAPGASVRDILVTQDTVDIIERPRLQTSSTHGTGCTLSTAIACGLAQHLPLIDAIRRARDFVQGAIAEAPGFGHGHGPLNHMHGLARR